MAPKQTSRARNLSRKRVNLRLRRFLRFESRKHESLKAPAVAKAMAGVSSEAGGEFFLFHGFVLSCFRDYEL
jgi:hypothetical protein